MKVTLLYPPQQCHPDHPCKPEASLAYPYLAGALLRADHDVKIYDACVGNEKDSLDVFYNHTELESGLYRYGVSDDRILNEVADSDIVGITSIFTAQETMALETCRLIKRHFPKKLLITGGTNARSRYKIFLRAGFDTVCMSESENSIVEIANRPNLIKQTISQDLVTNLDDLPIPAWHLHNNERYWKIGRPHGASRKNSKYAPLMTSRGCLFKCMYCHISGEHTEATKNIGRLRTKTINRVCSEFSQLKNLDVTDLFIEDDTFLAHKHRAIELLKRVTGFGFQLWDINGVNLAHLFTRRTDGKYVPDIEILNTLQECGFTKISLPVESASQRIIDRYASKKWNNKKLDVSLLISCLAERGINTGVNYMLGYPDETLEEIETTIAIARTHIEAGAKSTNFMLVIPLPGTSLHDYAISHGYLDKDFNPDTFNWRQASMKNTKVPPHQLEEIHQRAYEEINLQSVI